MKYFPCNVARLGCGARHRRERGGLGPVSRLLFPSAGYFITAFSCGALVDFVASMNLMACWLSYLILIDN